MDQTECFNFDLSFKKDFNTEPTFKDLENRLF